MTQPASLRHSRWLAIIGAIVAGGAFLASPFGLPLLLPFLWLAGVILSGALVLLVLSSTQAIVGSFLMGSWHALTALWSSQPRGNVSPQSPEVTPPAARDSRAESPRDL